VGLLVHTLPMQNDKVTAQLVDLSKVEGISPDKVEDLEFIEIVDELEPWQWAVWHVEFSYQGVQLQGSLQGCPRNPEDFMDNSIEDVELCEPTVDLNVVMNENGEYVRL